MKRLLFLLVLFPSLSLAQDFTVIGDYGAASETICFPMYDSTDGKTLIEDQTLASGDCKIIDPACVASGTCANCTNLPVQVAGSGGKGIYCHVLASGETDQPWLIVKIKPASGDVLDFAYRFISRNNASAWFPAEGVDVASVGGTSVTGPDDLKADVSGLATASALATVDDFVDTEVAAIKAKTDQLTFTTTNKLDTRVDYVGTNAVTSPNDFKADLATIALDEDSINDGLAERLAATFWRMTSENIEDSTYGDAVSFKSGYGMIAQQTHRSRILGGEWKTYKSDDSTELNSRDVTTDSSAAPITGVGTTP